MTKAISVCLFVILSYAISKLPPELGGWRYINGSSPDHCPAFFKPSSSTTGCEPIDSVDPIHSLSWLISATNTHYHNDFVSNNHTACTVQTVSTASHIHCDQSIEHFAYEVAWRKRQCQVTVILIGATPTCAALIRNTLKAYDIELRGYFPEYSGPVHTLRLLDKPAMFGVSFLSHLYTANGFLPDNIQTLSLHLPVTSESLYDSGQGPSSHPGWQFVTVHHLLAQAGMRPVVVQHSTSLCRPPNGHAPPLQYAGIVSCVRCDISVRVISYDCYFFMMMLLLLL